MFSERLQVLIGSDQRDRLLEAAASRGTSVATLVREAIDLAFPSTERHRQSAAESLLAADPMDVPDIDELVEEIDELRGRRA